MPRRTLRAALHHLLLDDRESAAAFLAPRMLGDPESLTPEVRWCLLYLLRGVGAVAAAERLLEPGSLLQVVSCSVESARRSTARADRRWFEVASGLPGHWLGRYRNGRVRYSLAELRHLNVLLARLWTTERQRLRLLRSPLLPRHLRPGRLLPGGNALPSRG